MGVFSRFAAFTNRHPVVRGMISYATIWPASCIIQQSIAGKTWRDYDLARAARFAVYGAFFTAPTLYAWVRISTLLWSQNNLRTALLKAFVEVLTYGPAAMICFFFGMSLMEGKSVDQAKEEVKIKFLPTYKCSILFWPALQTINFLFVAEKNRVPFVSACSLVWCIFLSYMHELQTREEEGLRLVKKSENLLKS